MTTQAATLVPNPFVTWRWAVWAGVVWAITFAFFWGGVANFLPPPPQYWSTDEVVSFFHEYNVRIRLGMTAIMFLAPLYCVWTAVNSRIIQAIEGPRGVLALLELMGGVLTAVVILGLGTFWLAASFRIDARTPSDIHLMSDVAWLIFNMTVGVTILQMVSFGTAMLMDRRVNPLLPRWLGWLAYMVSLTFMFALFVPFVMRGPVAWHGLLTFYVALGLYFPWVLLCCCYSFAAIRQLEGERTGIEVADSKTHAAECTAPQPSVAVR